MSKVARYLQEHINGEVMTSADAIKYFSTDCSIFEITPLMVVYPRTVSDVRKVARFSWQLAERERILPITARGKGTDQSGGAIGSGISMVFPAHMNGIVSLNKDRAIVQPGANFGKIQQTLITHGRYIPSYPGSMEYSSIGGAVANNASGERSLKFGSMRNYTKALQVVLANGEVIRTSRLSKRELGKKMGLTTMEGEVYRQLDALIMDNWDTINRSKIGVTKNSAGYDLVDVKHKDGSFDLTPLIVGSQGTLGIVTEIEVSTEEHSSESTLVVGFYDSLKKAANSIKQLEKTNPVALEFIDVNLLNFLDKHNPKQLAGLVDKPFPQVILLAEFDGKTRIQKRNSKKAMKIIDKHADNVRLESNQSKREELWKIRHSAASVNWQDINGAKALPIVEDGVVPSSKFAEYINAVYELFKKHGQKVAIWGHAGDCNIHIQPFIDLSKTGDRQKAFKIMDEYYQLVISMGGSTNGEHGDGRLRGPYLKSLYGEETYILFEKTKKIFDPYGILNPGVKIGVDIKDLAPILRKEYSLDHLYDHMPRT